MRLNQTEQRRPLKTRFEGAIQHATRASLEPGTCIRIAGSQMAWNGCAAVRTHLRAGAKANRSLRSQFVCLVSGGDSRHAAGVHSGGYSAPLHSHPRIARIPFKATSGVARTLHAMATTQENANYKTAPREE
jgi:hypothetical protein